MGREPQHGSCQQRRVPAHRPQLNSWGWVDYIVFIAGFVICEDFTEELVKSILLQYLLALIGMVLIWLGYRLVRSMLGSKETLEELEERIKQQYRETVDR